MPSEQENCTSAHKTKGRRLLGWQAWAVAWMTVLSNPVEACLPVRTGNMEMSGDSRIPHPV